MKAPLEFDPIATPLKKGISLIEASAGTGKTFAVAMLVLRAVTEEDIRLERILVVTYTKAAVAELRERIRLRLVEARDILQGRGGDPDEVLQKWFASVLKKDKKKQAQYLARLQLALSEIDRASVFTIHGFCQRMLQEQALEAGQLFDMELLANLDKQYKKAAELFWRKRFYTLKQWQCSLLESQYKSPADLLKLKGLIRSRDVLFEPKGAEVDQLWLNLAEALSQLREWWQRDGAAFYDQFRQFCLEEKFKKDFREACPEILDNMEQFFRGDSEKYPPNMSLLLHDNVVEQINSRVVKKAQREEFIESLVLPGEELAPIPVLEKELLTAFKILSYREIESSVGSFLDEDSAASFDTLITGLSRGVEGEKGLGLKKLLQARFDFALIDEFQDTDAEQWHIFSTIFSCYQHRLYLIGDPKQAIYKFRGADIFSYFVARNKATNRYSLNKNYRSHPGLITAVNTLFLNQHDSFLFGDKKLDYQQVKAAKDGSSYLGRRDSSEISPFSYCMIEEQFDAKGKSKSLTSGDADHLILKDIVQRCLELLDSKDGAVIFQENGGAISSKPVLPRDIAILVRSHSQAEKYQKAMNSFGVPAVIAGKSSIFDSPECHELLLLLRAVQEFENGRVMKSGMTISLFGLSGDELYELWQDNVAVAGWYDIFAQCSNLWKEKGVLQMLFYLVEEKQLFTKLAALPFAERRIANYTHLFELLQEAETDNNYGPRQTILWLQSCLNDGSKDEESELRLESDEDALKIVTIHSSKGLQYPVVFCPDSFKRSARLKHEKNVIACNDGGAVVDFGSEKFESRRETARQEELAEDLRLLYVALTRAELCCYCFWADVRANGTATDSSFSSALAYLLFDNNKVEGSDQRESFKKLGQPLRFIGDRDISGYYHRMIGDGTFTVKEAAERSIKTDYQVTSYSALAALSDHADIVHSFENEVHTIEDNEITPYSELPKGARFGNCVHDLLEELPFKEISLAHGSKKLAELVVQKCDYYGIKADKELLMAMLADTVNSSLAVEGDDSFSLSLLDENVCLKEMEFYLQLSHMSVSGINAILKNESTVQNLTEKQIEGYMTGFVDLVCMYKDKYYVIDYKSNYLGSHWSDYRCEDLTQAMASHNYGLQYYIYSLVLHQHLKTFMADYGYQRHFGGVIYLFLRGMNERRVGSGVFFDRPDESLILELDQLFTGGGDKNGA